MIGALLTRIVRDEHARVMATLVRALRSVDLAEEALQDAYERAAERWPIEGVPERPGAWLTTVAKRRALDLAKSRQRAARRTQTLDDAGGEGPLVVEPEEPRARNEAEEEHVQGDDRLRLVFVCCHPALPPRARAALALRLVCGLSTREIARGLLEDEATTAQRISRAKKKIEEARIPFAIPREDELAERIEVALAVIYLVFSEGHFAAEHPSLVRSDLCEEAIRLARLFVELAPRHPDALALLALLLSTHARAPARLDASGELVLLEHQDRARWSRPLLDEGHAVLERAIAAGARGPYAIQAAIADLHGRAHVASDTDWPQIAGLYGALLRERPDPVVMLNAAVAMAMAGEPERALAWVVELDEAGARVSASTIALTRAELLLRVGRRDEALTQIRRALDASRSPAEQRHLARRLAELSRP